MPFDLIGFSEAAPGTGTVGIARAAGDTLYTGGQGDNITLRQSSNALLGVIYGAESTPGYCRVKQPSHKYYYEFIRSVDAEGGTVDPEIADLRFNPVQLYAGEDINVWSNNATDEDTTIGLFVGDGAMNPQSILVSPDIIMRGTVDQALTANTWTAGAVTWSQSLSKGRYAVIGLVAGVYKAANPGLTLVRLTGLDESYRPGVVAQTTTGDKIDFLYRKGDTFKYWGLMKGCTFPHTALPNIEALSAYANTDIVLEMYLKQIE